MKAYHIFLDEMMIDTVFYDDDSTNEQVKYDLINRWAYNWGIVVELGWPPAGKGGK